MDVHFRLIVEALEGKIAHPDDRRSAIVRAGRIAEACAGCSIETLTEIFGPISADHRQERAPELRQ
jgi:hypothetical protein